MMTPHTDVSGSAAYAALEPAPPGASIVCGRAPRWLLAYDCLRHINRDRAIHIFIGLYFGAALAMSVLIADEHKFAPFAYLSLGLSSSLWRVLVLVLALLALGSVTSRIARVKIGPVFTPAVVADSALMTTVIVFLGVFTSVKTMLPDVVPFYADPFLARLDFLLHGADPWRYTGQLLPAGATPVLERVYFLGWGGIVCSTLVLAIFHPRLKPLRTQYVWTFLLAWVVLGNLLAGAAMSAGPIYYAGVTGEPRFAGLLAYLAHHSAASGLAAMLWKAYVTGSVGLGTGISAFPSVHVANATLVSLLACRVSRVLACAAILFEALILVTSVHLGWHYAVDGYVSILATVLLWRGVGRALAGSTGRAT